MVHFVHPQLKEWPEVLAETPDPAELSTRYRNGRDAWIVQTYLYLKQAGMEVGIGEELVAEKVNVVHYDDLSIRRKLMGRYVVAIRADRPPVHLCHRVVTMSRAVLGDEPRAHFLPHWPQPGILPRDVKRGTTVYRVAFVGNVAQLAEEFRTESWRKEVEGLGMRFEIRSRPEEWANFENIDVVLAIRGVSAGWTATKPALKLINAWLAGCPAVLGDEPSYRLMRENEWDYMEAKDVAGALAALERLKGNPNRYQAMANNGRRRAEAYSVEAIRGQWMEWLEKEVVPDFKRWKQRGRLADVAHVCGGLVKKKLAARRFAWF